MIRQQDTLANILDKYTGEVVTYTKVLSFYDGTTMDDSKCDGVIYKKLITNGLVEYFRRNITGIINATWFGVIGDNYTNNTSSLLSALNMAALLGGREVFLPSGIYKTNSFQIPTGVKLVGEGTCNLPYFTGGDVTTNIKGTILLINGQTNENCVEFAQGTHNSGIEKMSIYNDTANSIKTVVRVSNLNSYTKLSNVEIGCTKVSPGDGLTIEGNTLYGTYEDVVVNCTGIGQSYEASVRRGLVLHATGNENRPNANSFVRGEFRGSYKSLDCVSDVTNAKFQGTGFADCNFESTYKVGMQLEFLPLSEGIDELTRIDRYALKWIFIDNVYGMSFTGCYGEIAGWPATYNDGINGVHPVVPVMEIGPTVINLSIAGNGIIGHLYDKSYVSSTYNKINLQDQNGTSYLKSVTNGSASMLVLGSGAYKGVAVRENKLIVASTTQSVITDTNIQPEVFQNHGTSYFGSNIRINSLVSRTDANNLLCWDEADKVVKTVNTVNGLTSTNTINVIKSTGASLKLSDSNNEVEFKSIPTGSDTHLGVYVSGTKVLESTSLVFDFKIPVSGLDAVTSTQFVTKSQLDVKKATLNADVAQPDATDLASAIILINEMKGVINSLQSKLRTATLLSTT